MTQATATSQIESLGFVSIQSNDLNQADLEQLIQRCLTGDTWYCLRSPEAITFHVGLPKAGFLSSLEGQVFSPHRELRWKRQGDEYTVLLLSNTEIQDQALQPLGKEQQWLIRDLNANFYPPTETRFPRGITYPDGLDIGQRYFIDCRTGIVQFVALRGIKRGK
ncbi:hypothetical protein PN498_12355 [Oscillatoria sp. CS-180]|uniref:hypothetical protein n=1 Tax=Oscillatoria sp. CS-180 TaxID=3021720 RepID=UPI00232CA056|nr:hypothetical protein [Oscillatoria sp. CS-180]MDB9526783.1 hypothetical protein [Oscillatoria sp. CS-180]